MLELISNQHRIQFYMEENIKKKCYCLNMISVVPEDGWLHSPLSGQGHSLGPVFSLAQLLQDSNNCNFELASCKIYKFRKVKIYHSF